MTSRALSAVWNKPRARPERSTTEPLPQGEKADSQGQGRGQRALLFCCCYDRGSLNTAPLEGSGDGGTTDEQVKVGSWGDVL